MRRLAFAALLACSLASLAFDLTLSSRLPRESDWAELAGALRGEALAGDAAQLWPVWAEEARLHIDSMPVLAEEDLAHADYPGFKRLWLVSLPRAPYAGDPGPALHERGATPSGTARRFGALRLQAWDLRAPEIAPLTPRSEDHEVDYVARRCLPVRAGSRFSARGPGGAALHVRAGIIGERAYDAGRPAARVDVLVDGALLGSVEIPRTRRDGTGWKRLDLAMPAGATERQFVFTSESADASLSLCLQAWISK
jgi:hypothetical protein